jgi:chromosome segregation ATPase
MKRALDESDARATELEMNKRALEGDLQRLSMILIDKDTEIQVHQERCDALIRQIQVRCILVRICSCQYEKKIVAYCLNQ